MIEQFRDRFGSADNVRLYRAPGRVNLIGEHTDYNLGFVLPMALQLACYVASAPSSDNKIRIFSENRNEVREGTVEELDKVKPSKHWADYPIGVLQELIRKGYAPAPANLLIRSTVPEGSGLSSSAALEVSTALAFLAGRELDRLELARLCQRAEVGFVGVPSGIMDQYVAVFGQEHAALRIDCRSLEHLAVPLPEGIEIVAVNSMVKHELAGSAYKDRTEECAAAVRLIRSRHPEVNSLRDVSPEQLRALEAQLPPVIARRARHVVTENARVGAFVEACQVNDVRTMGRLFVSSHRSLQQDYEVSCEELDFLVDTALAIPGVFGARMTGGGFGGCTVNLMRADVVSAFCTTIAEIYSGRFGVEAPTYICRASAGAQEIRNPESFVMPDDR